LTIRQNLTSVPGSYPEQVNSPLIIRRNPGGVTAIENYTYNLSRPPLKNQMIFAWLFAVLLSAAVAHSQATPPGYPTLPQLWVDNDEATDGLVYTPPQYELELGASVGVWVTGPPPSCSFMLSNYVTTFTGLQDAVNDLEVCRTQSGYGFYLDIPPGIYTTTNGNGLVIPQSAIKVANSFIVVRSTHDSSLPKGRTVCAHGIQDNVASSTVTDIGLNNPDCTGTNLYYAMGPSNSSNVPGTLGVISGITTLHAETTTLASVSSSPTAQQVNLLNGYVSPGNAYIVDSGANQETVTALSGVNQNGIYGIFTKSHASGVQVRHFSG
jgi:hypothetical protein